MSQAISVMSQAMNPLGVSRSRCIVDSDRERLAGQAARCRNPATRVPAHNEHRVALAGAARLALERSRPGEGGQLLLQAPRH